jgi:hypothetical protein
MENTNRPTEVGYYWARELGLTAARWQVVHVRRGVYCKELTVDVGAGLEEFEWRLPRIEPPNAD